MKILIADAFDASLPQRLAIFGEVMSDLSRIQEAQILVVRSRTHVDQTLLDQAPALRLVIRGGVGLDNVDLQACRNRGIQVLNTPRASSVSVAEMTMAFLIAIPSRLIEAHIAMSAGRFPKNEYPRSELYQKTLGLIGVGAIATEVAKRAQAFGMRIIAFDPYITAHPIAQMKGTLDEVLAEADFISLHTPLTEQTRGLINHARIQRMKPGVILVNTARAACVVEQDLAQALASGQVKAYGCDVWNEDPPASDCPLLALPNVFKTPHMGGSSLENLGRIDDEIVGILSGFNL